jgi:hypothetical protein
MTRRTRIMFSSQVDVMVYLLIALVALVLWEIFRPSKRS